jgi:hypothetical protein
MSVEANKALARRLFEAFYPGDLDVADEILPLRWS